MENNSLFKTRQLSKYRAWAGNKKGCLFYVPAKKAICLINAPWRQDDIVGRYDALHESEIKNITNQDIILQGFLSALLSEGSLENESEASVRELWEGYKHNEYNAADIIPEHDAMAFLIHESLYWTQRNQEILVLHFGRQTMYRLNQYISLIVKEELKQIAADTKKILFQTHAIFRASKNKKNITCTYINYQISPLDIYSFPAAYINYRMVLYAIGQILIAPMDMNVIAKMMLGNFSEYCNAANAGTGAPITYAIEDNDIPLIKQTKFDSIPLENREELYELYEQDLFPKSRHLKDGFYLKFFVSEIHYCRNIKDIKGVFTPQQKADIMSHCERFLNFSLKQLVDKNAYQRLKERLIGVFPSLKANIEEGKSNRIAADEASSSIIIPLPEENKYNSLVQYVIERRKFDPDFAHKLDMLSTYCARCEYLHSIIGWLPNPNSLGRNIRSRLKNGQDTGKLNVFPTR